MTTRSGNAEGSRLLGPLRRVAGMTCPICLLAAVVALLLVVSTATLVLLDRGRSFEQADLAARHVVELALQRTSDLMLRLDGTLRLTADAAGATAGTGTGTGSAQAGIDAMLAQRRRDDGRMLGLYVVGSNGAVVAGSSSTGFGIGALVPLCLRDQRVESGQLALTRIGDPAAPDRPGATIICALRGTARGAVVAMLAPELFASQYADLAVGPHGTVSLRDDVGRLVTRVGAGGVLANLSEQQDAPPAVDRGIVLQRRLEVPLAALVTVVLTRADILTDWWYRSFLLAGSGLTVIAFVGLAVLAARRGELQATTRLARLAALTSDLQSGVDPLVLPSRLAGAAAELVPCEAEQSLVDAAGYELVLLQVDRVRLGPVTLRRRGGGPFTAAELAALDLLARAADGGLRQTATLAQHAAGEGWAWREVERLVAAQATLLAEMSEASFTLDANWRIVGTNRNADRMFGEYPEDLIRRSLWEVFPELVGTPFEAACRRARGEALPATLDLQWARTDAWMAVRVFPREDGLVVYMQDIGSGLAAQGKLREADKLDAIGRLTGGIAHDFNNLLTVVLGNVEMLEQELPETGEIREMYEQIRNAAQSAARLTHQLLAFARRQPLSPVDVDVGRLVAGLDGLLRREMGGAITVTLTTPPTLWRVRVDPAQLEAAVLHLAGNAREAMPQGGRLGIACANLSIRKPDADQFGEIQPGNYVMVSVSDSGRGMAKEVLAHVFDPFFSTKPSGRGVGLGMSMVYGFVSQSGGHARIASEPGRGTTVRLYLPSGVPLLDEPGAPRLPGRIATASLPVGRERVLLVEDVDMVRDYARTVLTNLGYQVSAAADAEGAMTLLEAGLQPDLLLSDVLLPHGVNGLALADAVLELRPGTAVLFMSGYVENADSIGPARLDPTTNLLLKPFRRDGLAARVRACLDQGPARDTIINPGAEKS